LEQMVQKRAPRDRANLGTMTDGDGWWLHQTVTEFAWWTH
jgi:hypothetical protein